MGQRHIFGKSIDFRIIPQAYDEDVTPYSLTSARIYSDYPTDAQIENTATGHLEAVTSWTQVSGAEYKIIFNSTGLVVDPTPHASIDYKAYYIAVNFKLQSGASDVFLVERIDVYRPNALSSKIRVANTDVTGVESKISDLMTTTVIDNKILLAVEEIDKILRARGYERYRTFNREDLNFACKHLSTAYCCADLAGEGNQFWWEKAKYYEDKAQKILNATPVNFDVVGSGRPEPTEFSGNGAVFMAR